MGALEQTDGRSDAPADSARILLLMEAVESRFADFDADGSKGLDKNELTAAIQSSDNAGAVADGLAVLLLNYDDATSFASDKNADPIGSYRPASKTLDSIFRTDEVTNGISLKDFAAVELVASAQNTQNVLDQIRGDEIAGGWTSVGFGTALGLVGAFAFSAPTGLTQFAGAIDLALAAHFAWDAYDNFANSEVPKFNEYIQGKRASIRSWQ